MRTTLHRHRSQRLERILGVSVGDEANALTTAPASDTLELVPTANAAPSRSSSYLPGLDGLRALALLAVLLFHARGSLLPGGFLGVDVFFVISGFIITRGLLAEWQRDGRIHLGSFWLRRAKRLLPAVYLLIVSVLLYALLFQKDEVVHLRGDALAALAYVTNWRFIIDKQSYFDSFARPSAFRHLWSLAVEEQFYLLWPPLLAGALFLLRRRWLVVTLVLAGAVASSVAMALLYTPGGDVSRVYYGTDTRATPLLIGAALAFFVARSSSAPAKRLFLPLRLALDGLAIAAVAGLFVAMLALSESSSALYRGGLMGVALLTALLIVTAVSPHTYAAKALGVKPMRWLGERSYGIYLWHWPILLLVWPHKPSIPVLLLQFAAAVGIAALSYRFVEQPLRRASFAGAWRSLVSARAWRRGAIGAVATGLAVTLVSLGFAVATAARPAKPAYFDTPHVVISSRVVSAPSVASDSQPSVILGPGQAAPAAPPPADIAPPGPPPALQTSLEAAAAVDPVDYDAVIASLAPPQLPDRNSCDDIRGTPYRSQTERDWFLANCIVQQPAYSVQVSSNVTYAAAPSLTAVSQAYVTAIGDSVMLGAAPQLAAEFPNIDVDAAVGRQVSSAIAILQQRAASGALGQYVIIGMGNNGTFTSGQFDQIMQIIGPQRHAIFVNLKEDRSWEAGNNAVIAAGAARYPNVSVVDWHSATASRPDLFWDDLIHLRPQGAVYYAQLIAPFVK